MKKTRWTCGFCSSGNHTACTGAAVNLGSILRCGCGSHPIVPRCLECGNTRPEELNGWACANPDDCRDAIANRSAMNPLREELEIVRRLGGEARRRALAERTQRMIREAVEAAGGKGVDDEGNEIDLVADSAANLDRASRPRRPRAPRPDKGTCICGGANAKCRPEPMATKGGRFAPGHDASLKSALRRAVLAGDESARARMIELGWEQFLPVAV